jgi:hypothetical protein
MPLSNPSRTNLPQGIHMYPSTEMVHPDVISSQVAAVVHVLSVDKSKTIIVLDATIHTYVCRRTNVFV